MLKNKLPQKKLLVLLAVIFLIIPGTVGMVWAEDTEETEISESESDSRSEYIKQTQGEIDALEDQIREYESKIQQLREESSTLKNEIEYAESQIQVTQLRIQSTENQIAVTADRIRSLGQDIDSLSSRLDRIKGSIEYQMELLAKRQREFYKVEGANSSGMNFLLFLIEPLQLERVIQKSTYSKIMQERDRTILDEMDRTKTAYSNQKDIFEDKKEEEETLKARIEEQKAQLDTYKSDLEGQRSAKEALLRETQNDESKYQALLEQARQEFISLQAILAGSGIEGSGSFVEAGQIIGSVIVGPSCNSSGTHLHFTVREENLSRNPFDYLSPLSEYRNCSGPSCTSGGDPFNPSGDWQWPLRGYITMHQGYGYTWAVKNTWVGGIYSFHDGIDISSTQLTIFAVADGIYYRGYYDTGYCRLNYIRIDHEDGLQTYYLHVNY